MTRQSDLWAAIERADVDWAFVIVAGVVGGEWKRFGHVCRSESHTKDDIKTLTGEGLTRLELSFYSADAFLIYRQILSIEGGQS